MVADKQPRWWQRGVIYQIYPRSFKDSNDDGIGDLQGIIDKLDYLNDGTPNSLGIDAIWLSPFFKSPMADFGYDVSDYCDIDPIFGDLATFDHLVEAAHQHGIKIIIDYVPNHSSDQHRWFIESRCGRDNPKRDWYIWRDAKPDGSPPNNWGSWFGGSAWEWDELTGQYYLHSFVKEQPDLNWANPEVYAAMMDVLHFWMKRGVDGFRMDVVFLLVKAPGLPDNPWNPDADPNLLENDIAGRQLHLYDRSQPPAIYDRMREFRRLTDQYGDTCIVGEIWEPELSEWIKYYGDEHDGVADGLHLPFNFDLMEIPIWDAGLMRASVDKLEAAVPTFAQPNYVLGNHDRPRLATRYGVANVRTAAMLLLTLRGTPTLYNGDEIGMEDGKIPLDRIVDPQGVNLGAERSRDGCRTPLQWDSNTYAGFSAIDPWLPVAENYPTRNVAVQNDDPGSTLSFYRKLLWYRKGSPALHSGSYQPIDSVEGTYIYQREYDGERKLIGLNFTDQSKIVNLPASGKIVLSTGLDRGEIVNDTVTLRPQEGIIIELA
ncbi:MAG TPA: alpha-amylase family glycosyl hydrolase [Phototrophicaceae bacterium]|jgi:glycosidase|nr:alpha-amylase family glycosyl hydrolase [Phototrophicaceae bacterium]